MTITQQQALEALERVYYATHASFIDRNLVRQYIEQSTVQPQATDSQSARAGCAYPTICAFPTCHCVTAQPQAVVPAPEKYDDVLRPFLTLMRKELHANSRKGDRPGWLAMDANTALLEVYWHVAKLSAAVKNNDGPAIQEHSADVANMAMMVLDVCGGLARVEAAQPSAQAERAPVVLAVQPEYCTACDMTSNDKQRCEDCPRRASSGATTQAVRMLTPREIELLREMSGVIGGV